MKIKTNSGDEVLIDDSDFAKLPKNLNVHKAGKKYKYAYFFETVCGVRKFRYLHRILAGAKTGQFVDHVNGDTLDNRRLNLRISSNRQNQWNQRKVRGVVPFKGVTLEGGKYRSRIRVNGKKINLGSFKDPRAAAAAYKNAAEKYFGEFNYSNFTE